MVSAKLPQARTPRPLLAGERVGLRVVGVGEAEAPTTTCAPRSSAARRLARALSARVYSTNTSHGVARRFGPRWRRSARIEARLAEHVAEALPGVLAARWR